MLHGGDLGAAIRRFGGSTETWIDLSTGINPHAWNNVASDSTAPVMQHASPLNSDLAAGLPSPLSADIWQRLPSDAAHAALIDSARRAYRVPDSLGLVAAPGTETILSWLPIIAPANEPGGDVAILSPTYSSHAKGWSASGRSVREIHSLGDVTATDRIVVLVNPNNPDGRIEDPRHLLALAGKLAQCGGLLIVDEAFADVTPDASLLPLLRNEPVAVLRSFGKFFGLAGLRLGFLAGPAALAQKLSNGLGGWAVSGPALAIGADAFNDRQWQDDMRRQLARESETLDAVLTAHGLEIIGGTSLYRLVRHPQAHALHEQLAHRHVWTRCFDYSTDWLRLGLPANADERTRFDAALGQSLAALTGAQGVAPC